VTVLEAAYRQLHDLEDQLEASNPQLYRHLALYLQVLRDGLLPSVQQACFHLATQVYPDRYTDLVLSQRLVLHRRIISLVQRATCLLTVEQLSHLAAQMAREQHRQRSRQQGRLLEALDRDRSPAEETMPQGSVNLGLSLPIGGDFLEPSRLALHQLSAEPSDQERGLESAGEAAPDQGSETVEPNAESAADEEAAMLAMAEAFADWMGQHHTTPMGPTPWEGGALPTDPGLLQLWLTGFEAALKRRLRNLSHALNVDLLRLGITRTLLPVSLLDAALSGQLETLEAPANLLHLPLPFGPDPGSSRLEAMAVLLRTTDLELALPKLRTCRTRIQQHRQEVRRMAQHYRRIQRRVQALEAEQLWLQDINPAQPPTDLQP
jgi:hypothetical protein